MLVPLLILFFIFLLFSAFFSSTETAFLSSNPIKLEYLGKKGSVRARLVRGLQKRVDTLLATILIGNTLVNTAAASVSTFIFVSFMPEHKNQAVLLSTLVTTFMILVLSEMSPKTYAAYNPIKLSMLTVRPLRVFVIVFYPLVKFFTFISRIIFPFSKITSAATPALNEEEVKVLFAMGVKGMSSLRKRVIAGALDIGSRPVREVMVPRTQIKAIEIDAPPEEVLELIRMAGFSRFPVYRGRMDNIEGLIHAKDVIGYLVDNKEIKIKELMRQPFFVPESATMEKVLLQMQEAANHLVFVVDEFGNVEGLVTLEDIIEELVGEIQDEYDDKLEEMVAEVDEGVYLIHGNSPVKDVNQLVSLGLPERREYTTMAGFFLYEFGRIPEAGNSLVFKGSKLTIERMIRRHINLIRLEVQSRADKGTDEGHSQE